MVAPTSEQVCLQASVRYKYTYANPCSTHLWRHPQLSGICSTAAGLLLHEVISVGWRQYRHTELSVDDVNDRQTSDIAFSVLLPCKLRTTLMSKRIAACMMTGGNSGQQPVPYVYIDVD